MSRAPSSQEVRPKPVNNIPDVLQLPVDKVDFVFKLRDCQFMEFTQELDRNACSVYDLMYTVAKYHGDTIEADKVQIYIKVSEDELKPLDDLTEPLSHYPDVSEFYYNFDPIDGSLLIIPPDK